MIIYSHNLHEKLFGYAISREFIKYQSPFCDLLDDPTLALDFDLAINFNQALNGNALARENFTNTLILCSTDLDVTTLEFYKSKMEAYPIFFPEIQRINYTFGNLNRLPSDNGGFIDKLKNAVKDCLNSPCNLFTQSSDTIGKLAQGTLYATEGTTLPVGDLKDVMSTFTGGIAGTIFNKIPEIFQKSIVNLKQIGKNAWSESLTMLVEDDLSTLVAKAQNGESLRTNTAGYRYTPDLKSYLDLSEVASDILGNVAADLGDCFRRYQQAYRYNPYDPKQNQSSVSRGPIADQANGETWFHTSFGHPDEGSNSGGGGVPNLSVPGTGNKQTVNIPEGTFVSDYINFQSERSPNMITVYGGYIDNNNNWFQDLTLDQYSQTGLIAVGNPKYKSGPMVYNSYKQLENDGFTTSTNLVNFEESKFNLGIAINFSSLAKYLNASGRESYTAAALNKYFQNKTKPDDERIYAEITPEGKAPVYVKVFDRCRVADKIDFTVPTFIKVFGMDLKTTGGQTIISEKTSADPGVARGSVKAAKFDGHNVITTFSLPPVRCRVRFIVGKLSDVGSTDDDCGQDSQEKINTFAAGAKSAADDWKTYTSNKIPLPDIVNELVEFCKDAAVGYGKETNADTKFCIYVTAAEAAAAVYMAIGQEYDNFSVFGEGSAADKAKVKQAGQRYTTDGNNLQRIIDSCPKTANCR